MLHGNGELSIVGSCQLEQLMGFCLFPTWWYIVGQDLPLKSNSWHRRVTWLPESSNERPPFPPTAHVHFRAHCHSPLHHVKFDLSRDILASNQLHQVHYSISCLFVKLVWTTDLNSSRLVQDLRRSYVFGMWIPVPFLFAAWPGITCSCSCMSHVILVIQFGTVIFCVPCVLTVVAGHLWIQHPISTTFQFGLSCPANIVGSTLVLNALWCFRLSFMVILLTALVMASTNQSRLNISFRFWFSSRAWFNSDLTVAISAAYISILFWCLWVVGQLLVMWCDPNNLLTTNCHRCCINCLCAFSLAAKHHGHLTLKLEWNSQSQTLSPGCHSKVGVSQIVSILMSEGLICLPQEFWLMSYNFLTSICSLSANASSVSLAFWDQFQNPYQGLTISEDRKARLRWSFSLWKDCSPLGVKPR